VLSLFVISSAISLRLKDRYLAVRCGNLCPIRYSARVGLQPFHRNLVKKVLLRSWNVKSSSLALIDASLNICETLTAFRGLPASSQKNASVPAFSPRYLPVMEESFCDITGNSVKNNNYRTICEKIKGACSVFYPLSSYNEK
jgi:hypothetical protein